MKTFYKQIFLPISINKKLQASVFKCRKGAKIISYEKTARQMLMEFTSICSHVMSSFFAVRKTLMKSTPEQSGRARPGRGSGSARRSSRRRRTRSSSPAPSGWSWTEKKLKMENFENGKIWKFQVCCLKAHCNAFTSNFHNKYVGFTN